MRVSILSLLALATMAAAAQTADSSIVPGERIGPLALGMGVNEGMSAAIQLFEGAATKATDCTNDQDRSEGRRCLQRQWTSPQDKMTVVAFIGPPGTEKLYVAVTSREEHRIAQGPGIGAGLNAFIEAYGQPQLGRVPLGFNHFLRFVGESADLHEWAYWPTRGLAAGFPKTGQKVWVLAIFSAR